MNNNRWKNKKWREKGNAWMFIPKNMSFLI